MNAYPIPSLENICVVRVAGLVCDDKDLKKEILCLQDSDFENYTSENSHEWCDEYTFESEKRLRKKWDKKVNFKVEKIINQLQLPLCMKQKVRNLIKPVGLGMLSWARYYEQEFCISRCFTKDFLNSSFLTIKGTVDKKKIAFILVKNVNLDISQRYRIACVYFIMPLIRTLWCQIPREYKSDFYNAEGPHNVQQPILVKLWSYYLMGKLDELAINKNLFWRCVFEIAVENGYEVAARYCWQKLCPRTRETILVDSAMKVPTGKIKDWDWAIVCNLNERNRSSSWFPTEYYIDTVCFLLSQMTEEQQIDFLRKDCQKRNYSSVLECFLRWPYQDCFMEVANLMWGMLSEENYGTLLLKIGDIIVSAEGCGKMDYDYHTLLKELWCQSTDHYKRYVLSEEGRPIDWLGDEVMLKTGKELIFKLFNRKNFTHQDEAILFLFLKYATPKEKESIIFSYEGKTICCRLVQNCKWELLDRFIEVALPSLEKICDFKKDFAFSKGISILINLMEDEKWELLEKFLEWSNLSLEDTNLLKTQTIFSENAKWVCLYMILNGNKLECVERFTKWCLPSHEEITIFKKEFISSENSLQICRDYVLKNKIEHFDKFLKWCLVYETVIMEFKKEFAYSEGGFILHLLICNSYQQEVCNDILMTCEIEGSKWDQVERFLSWCFSSEEEVNNFKKELVAKSGTEIHLDLISASEWAEAQTFFTWCNLSQEDIKELKKRTLISEKGIARIVSWLNDNEGEYSFPNRIKFQNKLDLILRWCFTDKEAVFEFMHVLNEESQIAEENRILMKDLDMVTKRILFDFDGQVTIRRKRKITE